MYIPPAQNSPRRLAFEVEFIGAVELFPVREAVELLLVSELEGEEAFAATGYLIPLIVPLPYRPPIPVDALTAAVPEANFLLHFVPLRPIELLADTALATRLSELSESLPDPFCA